MMCHVWFAKPLVSEYWAQSLSATSPPVTTCTIPSPPLQCQLICMSLCQQGSSGGYDHDSDTDMIIDENQLSIGGMSDGTPLDQGASAAGQATGRKEVLQVGSEGDSTTRNIYLIGMDDFFPPLFIKNFFYSHEKCEYVMISVRLASQPVVQHSNSFNIVILSGTIDVINVKPRMIYYPLSFTN